jgi:hypothetical protein
VSLSPADRRDLEDLLDDLVAGVYTVEQRTRLNALLLSNSHAQQIYLDYFEIHTALVRNASAQRSAADREQALLTIVQDWAVILRNGANSRTRNVPQEKSAVAPTSEFSIPAGFESIVASLQRSGTPSPNSPILKFVERTTAALSRPVVWSTLAASMMFVGYIVLISWGMLGKENNDHLTAASTRAEGQSVATVRDTSEVEWSAVRPEIQKPESEIKSSQRLAIASGLVELQLKQGASLIIEGPAEWTIDGDNAATLHRGKLVARVSREAVGFKVVTPSAQVVDLGTEFGIEVLHDGTSRVDVFRGLVRVQAQGKPAVDSASSLLRAHESTTVSADPNTANQLTISRAEPGRFRRYIPPANPHWTKLPVQSYRYTSSIGPARNEYRNDPECRKLVDGEIGSFRDTDGTWVGFSDAKPGGPPTDDKTPQPAIRFELEGPIRGSWLHAVQIRYLIHEHRAIHAPNRVRARTAESQTALESAPWTEFGALDNEPAAKGIDAGIVKTATLRLPEMHGPHVEIEFYNNNEWTYLGEISILMAQRKEASTKDGR